MPKKTNTTINNSSYYRVTATIGKKPDGTPIRKQFYGSSKKEAETKRDEYLLNIKKGLSVDFDKAIFESVFKAWFENVLRPSVSISSYTRYNVDYKLRIEGSELSPMKLTEIRATNMQIYYNKLLQDYSVKTVKSTHKLLVAFFNYCVKSELIVKSPLIAVELPNDKGKADAKALSSDEIKALINASKADISNFIYMFAVFTGLRQGEILALTHSDIDFKEGIINVNKSVKYLTIDGAYKAVLSPTKTISSIRTVPILNDIQGLLKAHIRKEQEKHLKLGIPLTDDSILFSSATCGYRESAAVRKGMLRLYKRIGIEGTTFHGLRHTFCTILARQGVPLKTASILMGHSNIAITAEIYTHINNEELKSGISALSTYFK